MNQSSINAVQNAVNNISGQATSAGATYGATQGDFLSASIGIAQVAEGFAHTAYCKRVRPTRADTIDYVKARKEAK